MPKHANPFQQPSKEEIDYHQPLSGSREEHLVSDNKKLQEHIVKQDGWVKKLEAKLKALENRPGAEFGTPGEIVAGRDDIIRNLREQVRNLEGHYRAHKAWIAKADNLIAFQKDVMDAQSRLLTSGRGYMEALADWEKARSEITEGGDYD